MDQIEHFSKLYSDDKTKVFRVATEWKDRSFQISILIESFAWFATVTEEYINTLAKQQELQPDTYFSSLKNHICQDQSNISVDVKDEQFILYRTTPSEKLRLKYFVTKLEQISYESTVGLFIDSLVLNCNDTLNALNTLQTEKIEAITQKLVLEKRCEEFAEFKRKSDLEMYSAFILLLNEKKQRIRFLTELLECPNKQKKKEPDTSEDEQLSSDHFHNGRKSEVLLDSESKKSTDYNTDDEKQVSIKNECVASTSKSNFDLLGGDSPPPLLSKRMKINQSHAQYVKEVVPCKEILKVQPTVVQSEATSDDEAYNFNTQELVDRM